ncbi:MAG: hypothetical protein BWY66_00286 [bacterium ADurb.Bin374]|nr:MAG: hypothetical protein BWY66_00286 [bacterium ADurb.Bin374]
MLKFVLVGSGSLTARLMNPAVLVYWRASQSIVSGVSFRVTTRDVEKSMSIVSLLTAWRNRYRFA